MTPTDPPMVSNGEMARLLDEFGDLIEIAGENPFKVRAYRNAAGVLRDMSAPVAEMVLAGDDLTTIKGVGKEIALKLADIATTGRLSQLDDLSKEVPLSLLELRRIKGVGPKLVQLLWRERGITSVAALEEALAAGNLEGLPGIGEKKQEAMRRGIEAYHRHVGRTRLMDAQAIATPLLERLRGVDGVERVEVAGSFRRRRDTVGDLDFVAVASGGASRAITEAFVSYPEVAEVLGSGETRSSVMLANGMQVDLRVMDEVAFGAALLYFTGSKPHNIALRQRALDQGYHLSEYGLFAGGSDSETPATPGAAGELLAGRTEQEIYSKLGLDFIPPELREDRGEIAAAAAHELPDLISLADIRGDLHMHSTWSDGKATITEMMDACVARGYSYMALTDHSKALAMTGGLDEAKLERQWAELDEILADRTDITLLRGMEVDILKDGSLDLSDEWLERLDIVLISVHSFFDLPQAEQTERVIRAVSHPSVNVLAHLAFDKVWAQRQIRESVVA